MSPTAIGAPSTIGDEYNWYAFVSNKLLDKAVSTHSR